MAEAARSGIWPLQAWKIRALVVGATLSLLVTAVSALPYFSSWQEAVDLYVLFKARGPRAVPENVVIVPIDGRATRRLFLPASDVDFERCADVRLDQAPSEYRNPNPPDVLTRWPRCLHARALDALAVGDPDVIVMDISFRPRSDPSGIYAEQDRTLAAAMRRFGRVVLARKLKSEDRAQERLQPIAAEIETAAVAIAPFLLLGDQLQRADKFCTFVEDNAWSGPCMPALAHQVAALGIYSRLRELLFTSDPKHSDLLPAGVENLLAAGSLQAPVSLIRHLATSDVKISAHMRTALDVGAQGKPAAEPRLRGLTDIYLGAGTRYFNFYGAPGLFKTLRYEALVAGKADLPIAAGSLRGKTIFIGFAEYGRPEPIEHFTTPFTTRNSVMSGVELAATAYANLQDGSAIESVPPAQRTLIVLAAGLVCLVICVFLPRRFSLPICLLLVVGYFAGALGVFEHSSVWLPVLMPLGFAVPVGVATGLTFEHTEMQRELEWYKPKYLRTEEERARLEHVTGELLPPAIRQRVMAHRQILPKLLASGLGACVNTDIEGSTKYAENRESKEVLDTLNEYFQLLDAVIGEQQVLTSDYTADGLMAVWAVDAGSLAPSETRERVCAAALRLAFVAEEFRLTHYLKEPDKRYFETRIGACFGELQVGMLGGASHGGYRAIGNVPNTATALQNFNKVMRTKVLVAGDLIEGLDQHFLSRELGHFILPKKGKKTHVFELMGLRSIASTEQLETRDLFRLALKAYRENRHQQAMDLFSRLAADGPAQYYRMLCASRRYYAEAPVFVEPSDVEWAGRRAQAKAAVQNALRG
jgi:adenylate cyclase